MNYLLINKNKNLFFQVIKFRKNYIIQRHSFIISTNRGKDKNTFSLDISKSNNAILNELLDLFVLEKNHYLFII